MNQFDLNAEKSFIGAWFINDLDLCDQLIDHFENSTKKFEGVITGPNGPYVNKDVKDSIDLDLDPASNVVKDYAKQLQLVLDEYVKLYPFAGETAPFVIERANIQKYNPNGGFFPWHTERDTASFPSVYRHLVFMTYLNDVNDAGETEFFHQKIKVKPRKGLTLIWPSDWTHYHRGVPSTTETKYIVTGWYIFQSESNSNLVDK